MRVDLHAILQPGDLRTRQTLGDAEERNLMAQHVFIVKVGGLQDFCTLFGNPETQLIDPIQAEDTKWELTLLLL